MSQPEDCYAGNKSHSHHDLLAPGAKCQHCEFVLAGLKYIADSPPDEYGGFHRSAVQTAKDAIAEIAELERERDDIREAEAACCPEDVGFSEYIAALTSQLAAAREVMALDDHFGYEPDWDHHHARIDGWYCRGPRCGQPFGKPHLNDCIVAALAAMEKETLNTPTPDNS